MRALPSLFLAGLFVASSAAADDDVKFVPGQWTSFSAPRATRGSVTRLVFVPERKPESGERIPALPKSGAAISLRCLGEWQLRSLVGNKSGAPQWVPHPSGDDRWVWTPGKSARVAIEPAAVPESTPDYGDEFVFCATSAGETSSVKPAAGKRVPGSWVTLVDGKRSTTLFVANTAAAEGDVLPDAPAEERRIRCPIRSHPLMGAARSTGRANFAARPSAPYGRWVADPFGSKRWAWVPSVGAPFALRPSASPTEPPPHTPKKPCSWFEASE